MMLHACVSYVGYHQHPITLMNRAFWILGAVMGLLHYLPYMPVYWQAVEQLPLQAHTLYWIPLFLVMPLCILLGPFRGWEPQEKFQEFRRRINGL